VVHGSSEHALAFLLLFARAMLAMAAASAMAPGSAMPAVTLLTATL
jgi:hypothetical protein